MVRSTLPQKGVEGGSRKILRLFTASFVYRNEQRYSFFEGADLAQKADLDCLGGGASGGRLDRRDNRGRSWPGWTYRVAVTYSEGELPQRDR